jgi:uncharacterized phage infection (PIP) family protein YhgE
MLRTLRAALAALMIVASFALVACGESEDNQFKEDYNQAVKPLSELNSDIGNSIGTAAGKSNSELANEFNKLADKAQQTRDNLSDLDPPDDAKEEFDKLLSSLQDGTDDLKAVAQAAKDGDPQAAAKASQDLVQSGTEIQKAETALQQAVDG